MTQEKSLPSKQDFRDRLRSRRESFNYTQRTLAAMVGISPGAIGRMETEPDYARQRPTVMALAHALKCDADWLDKGVGHPEPTAAESAVHEEAAEPLDYEALFRRWLRNVEPEKLLERANLFLRDENNALAERVAFGAQIVAELDRRLALERGSKRKSPFATIAPKTEKGQSRPTASPQVQSA